MEATVTHEAGHALGLADIYNPGYPQYVPDMLDGNQNVTMYGFIKDMETAKRTLASADIAGINWMFANVPESHLDLVLVLDGSNTFTSTYQAFDPSRNSAEELITKLRYRDRISILQFGAPGSFQATVGLPGTNGEVAAINDAIAYLRAMTPNGSTDLTGALGRVDQLVGSSTLGIKAAVLFSDAETTDPAGALNAAATLGLQRSPPLYPGIRRERRAGPQQYHG